MKKVSILAIVMSVLSFIGAFVYVVLLAFSVAEHSMDIDTFIQTIIQNR